jgi:hypothetical protein
MNKRQESAARRLEKALDNCHKAGLTGGVYDCGTFCLWPANCKIDPRDTGSRFFETVDEIGIAIHPEMILDGGAGV